MLLAAWHYLRAPGRRSATRFAVTAIFGLLVYPLLIPYPASFLLACGLVIHRRRRPAGERTGWLSALRLPLAVVAVPAALLLGRSFFEKTLSALSVIAPRTSLAGWHFVRGPVLPGPIFLGLARSSVIDYVGLIVVRMLAWR